LLAAQPCSWAQGSALLTVDPPQKITAPRKGEAEAAFAVHVRSGYHVNSNTPAEDYYIPLRLTWEPGALNAGQTVFPKPELQKYEFSTKPLSVFTGDFKLVTRFKVEEKAPAGMGVAVGKLRYQACNETTCFPPKTVEIRLPYEIR
jgi:hypothetical protein